MRIPIGLVALMAPVLMADSLSGVWQATVKVNGLDIPFRIELQADGAESQLGTLFNGEERFTVIERRLFEQARSSWSGITPLQNWKRRSATARSTANTCARTASSIRSTRREATRRFRQRRLPPSVDSGC